jgi:hypothetical protein
MEGFLGEGVSQRCSGLSSFLLFLGDACFQAMSKACCVLGERRIFNEKNCREHFLCFV